MTGKTIPGYSRYTATEDAIIWDTKNGKEVAQVLTGIPQYKYVNLWNDFGKRVLRRVHNLVALTHIPNPDNLPMVDHRDQDKMHNHVSNLRWVTRAQNQQNTRNNVVPGGLKKFIQDAVPSSTQAQYMVLWKLQNKDVPLQEAWKKVFPDFPFPPQKNSPLD